MKKRRRILFYSSMLGLTAVLVLVLGELTIRLLVPESFFWVYSNDYRAVAMPGVGYTFKPNLDKTAFGVGLRVNDLGFRGENWTLEKSDDTLRIALIGDSHAFGYGVPFHESMGEVLERLLSRRSGRRVEVLNFGVNGYNSGQQLAVLRSHALAHEPDLVLIVASSNDHEPMLSVDPQGWPHSVPWGANPVYGWGSTLKNSIKASRLFLFVHYSAILRLRLRNAEDPAAAADEWKWDEPAGNEPVADYLDATVYEPLVAMVRECRSREIPVALATFASTEDYRILFFAVARNEGVPLLELLSLLPRCRCWNDALERFGLGWNDHLNMDAHRIWAHSMVAHRIWAESLADLLTGEDFVPRGTVDPPPG